jgi:hypothetical protein
MPAQGPVTAYLGSVSPNPKQSPQDMLQVADGLAQDLLGRTDAEKRQELAKLRQNNEALHAMVKAKLDQIRRDTRSTAGNQVLAQQQQQGGGAAA